jgi:hypothetical protein
MRELLEITRDRATAPQSKRGAVRRGAAPHDNPSLYRSLPDDAMAARSTMDQALPSLSQLTLNATSTGALLRDSERATFADKDELLAVLEEQRTLPEAERAFEGGDDALDRLIRSAAEWAGMEAPPGDLATADDIQKHLVYFLTFDKKLFRREAVAVRLLEESTSWFETAKERDGVDEEDEEDDDRRQRVLQWRRSLAEKYHEWVLEWLNTTWGWDGQVIVSNAFHNFMSNAHLLERDGLRHVVTFLLLNIAADDLEFYRDRFYPTLSTGEKADAVLELTEAFFERHVTATYEFKACIEYWAEFEVGGIIFDVDRSILREQMLPLGLDGGVKWLLQMHQYKLRELVDDFETYRAPAGSTWQEYNEGLHLIYEEMQSHLVSRAEITADLLERVQRLTPPEPPPFSLDHFPPLGSA